MSAQGSASQGWARAQHILASVDPLGTTQLTAHDRVETRDPIVARAAVTRMLHAHALDVVGETALFNAQLACARLAPLDLIDVSYGSAVRVRRDGTDSYCAVVIPLSGRIAVRNGRDVVVAEPYKTMVVLGDGQDLDSEWEAGSHAMVLKIDRLALSDALDLVDHRRGRRLSFSTGEVTGASGFAMYGAVQLLAQTFEREGSDDVNSTWRRHLIQHTLLTAILALPHSLSADLGRTETIRSATVRRAVELMDGESSAQLSIPDLAAALGVGVRALELGFHNELETTPREFLRSTRLSRAREELRLADPATTTVSDVASKWGFTHHGRFANLYRMRFGEAPAQTLRG